MVGIYLLAVLTTVFVVSAYYNTTISDYKQEYNISSLNFSVNGVSAKQNLENDENKNTHTVDLTDIELDHNDGFAVDINLQARGNSNGSYAISYNVQIALSEIGLEYAPYIQVFRKVEGEYIYYTDLLTFSNEELTGHVGLNDDKLYNYLFVVSPNTNNIDYPYYYLSNSFEGSGSNSSGSIFSKLSSKSDELAGKTIVLTSDFSDFRVNEIIVLPHFQSSYKCIPPV